jgi:hypothetical protein
MINNDIFIILKTILSLRLFFLRLYEPLFANVKRPKNAKY